MTINYNDIGSELNLGKFISREVIQTLWSGYGEIVRLRYEDSTIVLKHAKLPQKSLHPKGWNTQTSHTRKIHSYDIEVNWYNNFCLSVDHRCRMPLCLNSFKKDGEWLIAMEDLSSVGLNCTSENATKNHLKTSLSWLANFHAKYMGICSEHIWRIGTYWHLDTRPDELEALEDQELKISAKKIDNLLNNSKYQTIVHGDAKLANFCFNTDATECGAVDFQYVGHGSGIKDVMYFMSSAIKPENSQMMQEWILEYYFSELKKSLNYYDKNYCYKEVEQEYRKMFEVAWADFYRFIMGWSPNHFKANAYSKALTQKVLRSLK